MKAALRKRRTVKMFALVERDGGNMKGVGVSGACVTVWGGSSPCNATVNTPWGRTAFAQTTSLLDLARVATSFVILSI